MMGMNPAFDQSGNQFLDMIFRVTEKVFLQQFRGCFQKTLPGNSFSAFDKASRFFEVG